MTRTTATTWHEATPRRLIALACMLGAALVPAGAAQARLGDFDPTFAGDGIATPSVGGVLEGVAARPTGEPVAVGTGPGEAFVVRLTNGGGVLGITRFPDGQFVTRLHGVALDGQGRILAAGDRRPATAPPPGAPLVTRLTPTGAIDPGFAGGFANLVGEARAVVPAGNGMLVAGWRAGSAERDVFFVARLDQNGRPDPNFGVVDHDFGVAARAYAMAVDAGGRIVLAGVAGSQPALAVFSSSGQLVAAHTYDFAGELRAVAVDGAGRITAAGVSGSRALVVRRLASGAPDPGFGTGGATYRDAAALNGLALNGARTLVAGVSNRALLLGSLDAAGAPEPALAWRGFPGAGAAFGAALGPNGTVYTAGGPAPFVARHLPNAAPAAALTGPAQVVAGGPAVFDAGGSSDPEGEPLGYAFDLDGNGSYEFDGGGNALALRSFPAPGSYSVGVRVTDPRGASATATRAIAVVAAAEPPPQPELGEQGVAQPLRGSVRVRLPGTRRFVRLTDLTAIPNGTEIDARKGRLLLTVLHDATGRLDGVRVFGGRFFFRQFDGATPITRLKLSGGSFKNCTRNVADGEPRGTSGLAWQEKPESSALLAVAASAKGTRKRSKRRVRKLWGDGRGRFRTRGRYGAATVRGTKWLTRDRCDGTKVRVLEGRVSVKDVVRPNRRPELVRAGESALVRHKR